MKGEAHVLGEKRIVLKKKGVVVLRSSFTREADSLEEKRGGGAEVKFSKLSSKRKGHFG